MKGVGAEREIVINGKKLGSGDYTLTDNSFSTKVTVADGNWLEPKITWEGKLPKNKEEAAAFLMKNRLQVSATGSRRHFNGDLSWKMDRPDFDFTTPWDCKMTLNLEGEGPNWGTYSLKRDMKASVANKVIEFSVGGDASFTEGVFAKISPVHTDVKMKYLMNERDLIGKFSKVMKAKNTQLNSLRVRLCSLRSPGDSKKHSRRQIYYHQLDCQFLSNQTSNKLALHL